MTVTNVRWTIDRRGRRVLDLDLDGHPAHIHSSQKTELLQRGTVDGMVFFASERAAQVPNIHIRGGGEAASAGDLIGVTNDPQVFALSQDMAAAIRRDTWRAGPRPAPVAEPRRDRQAPRRITAPSAPRSATSSHRGVAE